MSKAIANFKQFILLTWDRRLHSNFEITVAAEIIIYDSKLWSSAHKNNLYNITNYCTKQNNTGSKIVLNCYSSPSSNSSSSDKRACRICQSETGEMVRPCACTGTVSFIQWHHFNKIKLVNHNILWDYKNML